MLEAGEKHYYGLHGELPFHTNPVPLRRLYILEPAFDDRFEIAKLAPGALMQHVTHLQIGLGLRDATELESNFRVAERLTRSGVCYWLQMPRDLARLPYYAEKIAAHACSDVS
jgi:hypothetical protein